jgi:DNA-binding NarL/FixJ family response regulator
MLTMSDEITDLYEALRAGATGYVVKTSEVSEIADSVRSVHRGDLVIPGDLANEFVRDLDKSDPRSLSHNERDILTAIARGETNREIAKRLRVSERTVKRRIEDIYSKLHLADRLQAAIYAVKRGLGAEAHGP